MGSEGFGQIEEWPGALPESAKAAVKGRYLKDVHTEG